MYGFFLNLYIVPTEQICFMPWTWGNLALVEVFFPQHSDMLALEHVLCWPWTKKDLSCSMTKAITRAKLVDMPTRY